MPAKTPSGTTNSELFSKYLWSIQTIAWDDVVVVAVVAELQLLQGGQKPIERALFDRRDPVPR